MISVEEALDRILALVATLEAEDRAIDDVLGQVLAGDVVSHLTIPPLANTAMDGYAVRAADTRGASTERPVPLRVIGELAAGYIFGDAVGDGEAVRIMTGAPIPPGADAIVPFEETNEDRRGVPSGSQRLESTVSIFKEAQPHANVRDAGEDIREGETVLRKGKAIGPADVGVLASLGLASVSVVRRPVVSILSTGDELLKPGDPHQPGRIYDSNAWGLSALVKSYGGIPRRLGIATDSVEQVTAALRGGLDADMLVTSAGVSRGDYDVVKEVLAREGDIDFWTVRMKPGKPLAFGSITSGGRRIPHLGLPGNPVSAMVTFELFGRPAIQKMMGKPLTPRPTVEATTQDAITTVGDPRRFYARCIAEQVDGRWRVRLAGGQGSGVLSSMARANALAIVPEGKEVVEAGETVRVMLLDTERPI
ncbi:MAG: molybdopterin molybdenumtransferase MoeA [Dehalococcoidia bacterium]|nr:molybdopterin molybdenumtransferase MoeA [Dehalococcoidia bacterium]